MDTFRLPQMKTMKTTETLRGKFFCYYYEYPAGNRSHGGGGWSRQAKHRPAPVLVCREVTNPVLSGKSVLFDDIRKLKCTLVRKRDGAIIRQDYPLERITQELLTKQSRTPLETPEEETTTQPAFGPTPRKIHHD